MYIAPNSTIKFLKNVPLDTTYDHTIYWDTTAGGGGATAQKTYFESKVKATEYSPVTQTNVSFTLGSQSYQRVKRGYLRCEIPADMLYDCNYIMFQNTSFGARWFYAFIKSVEYVNNIVSEVQYELDVMQTWHFDYELEDCFVEREHTATDEIGDNTIPENLEIGDYLFLDAGKAFSSISDYSLCIAATWRLTNVLGSWYVYDDGQPGFYNGVFSGLHYNTIDLSLPSSEEYESLFEIIVNMSEKRKEEIVAIFMIPTAFISQYSFLPNQSTNYVTISKQKHISWDGFTPKNKKLFTYPYNTLYVTSSDGDSAYFKYELFKSQTCDFHLEGAMGIPPELGLTPKAYAFEVANVTSPNYNFTMSLKNFPMCSWVTDSFKAWLAQNATRLVAGVATTVAGALATGGVINATAASSPWMTKAIADSRETANAISAGSSVANSLLQVVPAMLQPDHAHGVSKASLALANGEFGYHFYYARIKNEFAKVIDDYFTRYGYAIKRNKKPNRTARPHWTYTKAIGCTIKASIPSPDAKAICDIYNNGITFWKNASEIGDYSLNNSPVTP